MPESNLLGLRQIHAMQIIEPCDTPLLTVEYFYIKYKESLFCGPIIRSGTSRRRTPSDSK